jgi:hypothetical protein
MGKRRKRTPEERDSEFRELLRRRAEVDRRLAAERGEPAPPIFSLADTHEAWLQRDRALQEVLERRVEVDRRLAAERLD